MIQSYIYIYIYTYVCAICIMIILSHRVLMPCYIYIFIMAQVPTPTAAQPCAKKAVGTKKTRCLSACAAVVSQPVSPERNILNNGWYLDIPGLVS